MFSLPAEGSSLLQQFRGLFTKRSFSLLVQLLAGALLSVGARTVCAALRFLGLGQERAFHKYHRFLSRARWSALKASRTLLQLLVDTFCGREEPLVFGIDETIERRRGARIKAKGIYRDPVRSSQSHFVKCSGLRWMCMMLLAPIPWAARVWALPFLTALAPSERYCTTFHKHHKKLTDWARQLIALLCRWLRGRRIIVTADSSYSALELLSAIRSKATIITRLRLDAALYDPVAEPLKKNPGRPRVRGERQPALKQRLEDTATVWTKVVIPQWYGQKDKEMYLASGTALWYHSGMEPVPLRWVLLKDPDATGEPAALLSTDMELEATEVVNYFIRRWTVEVTLKEVRTHLGVETQRQFSDAAIARTTPCLMALFSITALWADSIWHKREPEVQTAAWYKKKLPTFSDALAAVRHQLWTHHHFCMWDPKTQTAQIQPKWLSFLINTLARAA
jgi:hypothetical protein